MYSLTLVATAYGLWQQFRAGQQRVDDAAVKAVVDLLKSSGSGKGGP